MNIVLTGLRGSGKSKLGKLLAKKLNWNFVDLDKEIEKSEKMKISKIVEKKGWEYFRKKESEMVKQIHGLDKTILATGGGTVVDKDNEKELKKIGKIVYLYRKPEDCCKYIKDNKDRPALTEEKNLLEEMQKLYVERNNRYCKSAYRIFNRTNDLENDTEEIINQLELDEL